LTVSYAQAAGSVPQAISRAGAPDVAILSLPDDRSAMGELAAAGTIKPIGFAAPLLDSSYAFSWKQLGSTNGRLYGLVFKATNGSAFWYDQQLLRNAGISAPTNWGTFIAAADRLTTLGVKPFAVSGAAERGLVDLFENTYLAQFGNRRYDELAQHRLGWTDPSVRNALATMRGIFANPDRIAGGSAALREPYPTAVMRVFGSPAQASMVLGGSAALPILRSAKAARPLTQFGVLPFPQFGKSPPRVIGEADAVVMVKDSPAARDLIRYLGTPEAAQIWAKRGGFLSPNRKLDLLSYSSEIRPLAAALAGANTFRLSLTAQQPARFKVLITQLLPEYVSAPARVGEITGRLDAAAASGVETTRR
jgi:alpha-glucoside transport system substrate-binding protein